jgi:DNA-binding NarL/FixJ family response regulator
VLTHRAIAARLYLSERTAQNYVQQILTKLDLSNRGQIAVWIASRS